MTFFSSSKNDEVLSKPLNSGSERSSLPKKIEPSVNPLSHHFRNGNLIKPKESLGREVLRSSRNINPERNILYKSVEEGFAKKNLEKKELLKEVQQRFGQNQKATSEDLLKFFAEKTDLKKNKYDYRKVKEAKEFVKREFGVNEYVLEQSRKKMAKELVKTERELIENRRKEQRKLDMQRQALENSREIGRRVGNIINRNSNSFNRRVSGGYSSAAMGEIGVVRPKNEL